MDNNPRIVEVPKAPAIGSGVSFLNGNPLPVEAWLSQPGPMTPTVLGCGDTGGQCLIKKSLVPPGTPISRHPSMHPSFSGIGGSAASSLGFVVMAIFLPDVNALNNLPGGTILKLWIEFQVIAELDCNFLIGRDATRAYGIDFIESQGCISIGEARIPIADGAHGSVQRCMNSVVRASEEAVIPPHTDQLLRITLPPGAPDDKVLLFHPANFLDPAREIHGRIPWTLLYTSCSVVHFSNLCGYPFRISSGQPVGNIEILAANTSLSFLCNPTRTYSSLPSDMSPTPPVPQHPDPDHCGVDPFGLQDESPPDDRDVDDVILSCTGGDLHLKINKSLGPTMRGALLGLLLRFESVFSFGGSRLGHARLPPMSIETTSAPPPRQPPYRESPRQSALIKQSMQMLKDLDVIEPGSGPMAAPVVMILQKDKWRFCVDFRGVNSVTPLDRYPIPRPDTVFTALSGAQFFSTMDANKGYHQFDIDERSRHLTAFVTQQEGQWQFKRVPFGLQNAPAFFQRSMDSLLGRHRWQFCLAYIDDIVIWSKSWNDHLSHISTVLSCFSAVGMTLDERKCNWGFHSVDLLGLRVTRFGLRTLEHKTAAVMALPFPRTIKELRIILGQFSYYRQFIPRFASIAEPLTTALKVSTAATSTKSKANKSRPDSALPSPPTEPASSPTAAPAAPPRAQLKKVGRMVVEPTPNRLAALDTLKHLLTTAPCLRYPVFFEPFFLYTDASKRGIGGALQQLQAHDNKQHPILFISRCLSPAEKNYSATELECLGVYWCFTKLSHYIDGSDLTVITDHHALQWLWNIKATTNSRLHKWAMLLLPWQKKLKILHRAGLTHSNVDPLSRFPRAERAPSPARQTFTSSLSSLHGDLVPLLAAAYATDGDFSGSFHDCVRASTTSDFFRDDRDLLWRRSLPTLLLCIPRAYRKDVLQSVHDELGHPGFQRALAHARSRFFWPTLSRDIKSYCRSCHLCQTCKTDTARKPGCLQPIAAPNLPFHTLCIDFVEGLPTSTGGFNSFASVMDKFSKAIRLLPCKKSDTGPTFAQRFFQGVYPMWGVPDRIISDRDRRFVSSFWSTLMRLAGTKVALTAAYHPQANGQAERTNRTVETIIRILCIETSLGWLSLLPHVELVHNSTPCLSTGFSPFSLLYAHSPRLFGDKALPLLDNIAADAETLADDLRERRALASSAMTRAQSLQKKHFDARHSPLIFVPGDWALFVYSSTLRRPHKLAPTGSVVQILEAVSPVAYRIRVPEGSKMHDVVSIELLRRYRHRGPASAPTSGAAPPALSPSPSILAERDHDGRREVQVEIDGELIWRLDTRPPPTPVAMPVATPVATPVTHRAPESSPIPRPTPPPPRHSERLRQLDAAD